MFVLQLCRNHFNWLATVNIVSFLFPLWINFLNKKYSVCILVFTIDHIFWWELVGSVPLPSIQPVSLCHIVSFSVSGLTFVAHMCWFTCLHLHHLWRETISNQPRRVGYTQWQCAQSCCMFERPGHWRQKTYGDCRCCDHRCLRSIGKIRWEHTISNTEVRRRVLGLRNMSIKEQLHNHRLRWLGYVLRMSDDRLPRRALFAAPKSSWKRPSSGQHMTWQRNMKSLTEGLSHVGNVGLAGLGPRDPSQLWVIWHLVVSDVLVLSFLPFLRDTLTTHLFLNFSHWFRMWH